MLHPEGENETTIVNLFGELTRLADRYDGDRVMVKAVEHVGSAIITLLNDDVGRLDLGAVDKQVRDVVDRAGGDSSDL